LRAQGATEYLVLLAIVLIVALVSVALLGFFPGMASDAQLTQSQAYWKSASPIAIIDQVTSYSEGMAQSSGTTLILRNTGAYPIRITKILGGTDSSIYQFKCNGGGGSEWCGGAWATKNITDYFYIAPGADFSGSWSIYAMSSINGSAGSYYLYAASSKCQSLTPSSGTLVIPNFGFEYVVYIEGQQVTKRQIGKPLMIKCT